MKLSQFKFKLTEEKIAKFLSDFSKRNKRRTGSAAIIDRSMKFY